MSLVGGWLHQTGESARHIQRVVFCVGELQARNEEYDWMINANQSCMQHLRFVFDGTDAVSSMRLEVKWTPTNWSLGDNDEEECAIMSKFGDAATAREAFHEVPGGPDAICAGIGVNEGVWRDEDMGEDQKADMEVSQESLGQLMSALGLAFDPCHGH
ncbi:hypothetical protein DOTSEDRAFT_32336 [Dothistroma septosporum NZE10]|uniref:Uncharacterized protein n=1 Tax=Dothistroma septosporum (strain NZE10 / CBS 128990) TaxID=675120 RepID=N1PX53_DOTSN|nr:hypothetical protein DOTSEDRAFT_32336 [Dothistroma septosporum NZE10]